MVRQHSDRTGAIRGTLVFLYGMIAALGFAFLVYARQNVVDGTVDLNGFGDIARHLVSGEGFSSGFGPTIRRAPFYPVFAAGLLWATGSDTPGATEFEIYRPLLLANCVLFGLTCLFVYWLARNLFGDRVAIVAAAICPLVPQSLRYVGMAEVETLMGLWTVLLAFCSHRFVQQPGAGRGAVLGVTAALATLTKPVVMLFLVAFLPLAILDARRRGTNRRVLVGAATAFVCLVLPLIPWMARNAALTDGQFRGISSNASGEFLRGYINAQSKYFLLKQDFGGHGPGEKWDPEANAFEETLLAEHGLPFYRTIRDASGQRALVPAPPAGTTSATIELAKDRVTDAEMKRRLLQEPTGFVRKFVIQLFTFWYIVETRLKSVLVGSIALGMLTLAGVGVVRAHRSGVVVWPVVFVLLYFNVFYAAFLALARYSMPLFPTVAALTAAGLVGALELVAQHRRRGAADWLRSLRAQPQA